MAKQTHDRVRPSLPTGKTRKKGASQETENAIRPVKRRRAITSPEIESRTAAAVPKPKSSKASPETTKPEGARTVPPEVWERFIGIGSKYYFPDGTPAFVDRGAKLTTSSENTEVIRSLVSIAQARGWNRITVTGTERFRKEAWLAAQRVRIAVRGYKPSEVEQAQLVRGLAARRPAGDWKDGQDAEKPAATGTRKAHRGARPENAREGLDASEGRRGTLIVGRLLDHGRDTYRHDPREQSSYFVRLQTQEGEREVWGVDLERAVRDSLSNAHAGDDVTVRAISREPVTVSKRQRDTKGQVIGESSVSTHRNEWIVERTEFLAGRESAARTFRDPKISPQEAVKKHPELQGSYLKLQAVKLGAERDFKNPEDRERLVARARVLIAQSIERGEPLEPVRLREPISKKPEQERAIKQDPEHSR